MIINVALAPRDYIAKWEKTDLLIPSKIQQLS